MRMLILELYSTFDIAGSVAYNWYLEEMDCSISKPNASMTTSNDFNSVSGDIVSNHLNNATQVQNGINSNHFTTYAADYSGVLLLYQQFLVFCDAF
jgi:hypothetical protein